MAIDSHSGFLHSSGPTNTRAMALATRSTAVAKSGRERLPSLLYQSVVSKVLHQRTLAGLGFGEFLIESVENLVVGWLSQISWIPSAPNLFSRTILSSLTDILSQRSRTNLILQRAFLSDIHARIRIPDARSQAHH